MNIKQIISNLPFENFSHANDNNILNNGINNDVNLLIESGYEYIKKLSNELINGINISNKTNFIILLGKLLNIYVNEKSFLDKNIFFETILSYLEVSDKDFQSKFPTVYAFFKLNLPKKNVLDLMIKVLVCLQENKNEFNNLLELEENSKKEIISNLGRILREKQIPDDFSKEYVFFLIEISSRLKYFEKIPTDLKKIIFSFLEKNFLEYLSSVNQIGNDIGFTLYKRDIIKDKVQADCIIEQLKILLSNLNNTNNPIIIGFKSFPGGVDKFVIYQESNIFKPKENNTNTSVFTGDKKGFLEEILELNKIFCNGLDLGEIFSISVYQKIGGKTRPPLIQQTFGKIAA